MKKGYLPSLQFNIVSQALTQKGKQEKETAQELKTNKILSLFTNDF